MRYFLKVTVIGNGVNSNALLPNPVRNHLIIFSYNRKYNAWHVLYIDRINWNELLTWKATRTLAVQPRGYNSGVVINK